MAVSPIKETIVGSRVVEIPYSSPPASEPIGNSVTMGSIRVALSGGSRIIEIPYTSTP